MPIPLSMLIVERDDTLRSLLSHRFIQLGFDVTPVSHPRQALSAATFKTFQVAVVDHSLCEIDGKCLMQRLKLMVAGLQVVILTSQDLRSVAQEMLAAGAFDCLMKPCRLSELERVVEEALETVVENVSTSLHPLADEVPA